MRWNQVARLVRSHPGRVLVLSLLVLVPPAVASADAHSSYNVLAELPHGADSVAGYNALAKHFSRGQVSPLIVVLQRPSSMYDAASFRAINDLTVELGKIPGVASVRSITQPTGGSFSPEQLKQAGAGDLAAFPDRLQQGANGVAQVIDGLGRIRDGLQQMHDKLPALQQGLDQGSSGVQQMRDGIRQMRAGIAQMESGLQQAADGLSSAPAPAACSTTAAPKDLAGSADEARICLKNALDRMHTLVKRPGFDPQYSLVYQQVATAYGSLTGIDDTTGKAAAQPGAAQYAAAGGLSGELRTISTGLRQAIGGLSQLGDALVQLDGGLAKLGSGLDQGSTGVAQTVSGVTQMLGGIDRIVPGLQQLRAGLEAGVSAVRSSGIADALNAGNLGLTPGLIDSLPGLRKRLSVFLTDNARTTRLFVTLDQDPYTSTSLAAVDRIRSAGELALNKTPLQGTPVLVSGSASFFNDVRGLSNGDFKVILVAVILGIFLVLAILLRSVVAPTYLVLTVLLSFLATLGLTRLVFQTGLGQGLPWWLPPFLFVMLVALGADYNIFLMSRIREEAKVNTTADATARGLALTGHVITSAGLILAGTFAALLAAPMSSLRMFGFSVTVGILLDTFVVRSLLVPAVATLLGRHNWWPSRRAMAP